MFPLLLACGGAASAADGSGSAVTAQLYRGQLEQAIETARSAADANPDDLDAQELYIDLLLASRRPALAARHYAERVKVQPTDPDAHYLLGRAEIAAKDAVEAYERALRLDPDHARSHMGMGAVHTANGDLAAADAAFREALKRDGSLGEAWLGLVRVTVLAGDTEGRALEIARRGLAADPDEAGLALAVATMDPKNARSVLEASAEQTDDARVRVRLAELRLTANDAKGALAAAEEALKTDPGNVEAARMRAFAGHVQAGLLDLDGLGRLLDARDKLATDPKAATLALEALAKEFPAAPILFLSLAEAHQKAGNQKGALEALALTLQRDPELVDAQAAFGLALLGEQRYGEATPWLAKAAKARPWDPDLVRAFGHAQLRSGDVEGALVTLRTAHRARPWEVPTLLTYAEALQTAGQAEASYALVRDALRQSPDPRLAVGFVIAAQAAGHDAAAADFLEDLGRKAGSTKLVELAESIRSKGG